MTEEKIITHAVNKCTAGHLWNIANRLSSTCPAASRFYLHSLERKLLDTTVLLEQGSQRNYHYCKHCGNLWSPGNHRVRVEPAAPANGHIKKLLKWEREQPWKLNGQQKRKVRKYRSATSKIIYSCFICKKKSIFPGIQKLKRSRPVSTTSTSALKIKRKKGSLNAGLLIPTSLQKKETQEKRNSENDETPSNVPVTTISSPQNLISGPDTTKELATQSTSKNQTIAKTPSKIVTVSSSLKNLDESTSSKKKKKTLLGNILQEERKTKSKKKSLSDFLISL